MLDIMSKEYENMIDEMKSGKERVITPWGNAKIDTQGLYYYISSTKEGNFGKRVHNLVWEAFYGKNQHEYYDIHHKDANKLNNDINNIQCCERSKHASFHNKGVIFSEERKRRISEALTGKTLSDEHKQKMSEAKNTTGYLNVSKKKDKNCKQGFIWCYQYSENGKQKSIKSVDIEKLEAKVKSQGLIWKKLW